jgi:hypothetical protein
MTRAEINHLNAQKSNQQQNKEETAPGFVFTDPEAVDGTTQTTNRDRQEADKRIDAM